MPYNGELRELYNDLDKRISVDSAERNVWRKAFKERNDEHKEYIHGRMHDILNKLDVVSGKLGLLPCKEHKNELKWVVNAMWVLASVTAFVGIAIISFMVSVHLGGQ